MRITTGTPNWLPDMCRMVAALLRIWSSASRLKLTVINSTIGRMPAMAAPMPAPVKPDSDKRRVANALRAEFGQQPLAHRIAAAVAADVLAHQEDALVARSASRIASLHGLAIGDLDRFGAVRAGVAASRCAAHRPFRIDEAGQVSTGSQVPASAKATAASISAATSALDARDPLRRGSCGSPAAIR